MTQFMPTLEGVKDKERVRRSDCGPAVLELISPVKEYGDRDTTRDLVVTLCSRVQSCVNAGDRCKLPSAIAGKIWPVFYELRLNPKIISCGKHRYLSWMYLQRPRRPPFIHSKSF